MTPEPVKTCAECGETKPWSSFYAKQKWPDGTMRLPCPYCKPCHAAYSRDWHKRKYANDPEWRAQRIRTYLERLNANPARLKATRARQREWKRAKHNYRRVLGTPRPRDPETMLDAAPFAAWLQRLGDTTTAASATGLTWRTVYAYTSGERRKVHIDIVDAALLEANTLTRLDDLYPLEETCQSIAS